MIVFSRLDSYDLNLFKLRLTISTMKSDFFDIIVIGGGIIGISTAYHIIKKNNSLRVLILEKETKTCLHQSGNNSGVVHAGIYYEPNSLKAKFCINGHQQILNFCKKNNLPIQIIGKLIIATNNNELTSLESLIERCVENKIDFKILDRYELKKIEPNIFGLKALKINATAITDYKMISLKLLELFKKLGGEIHYNQEFESLQENDDFTSIKTKRSNYKSRFLISCAGLQSDIIAKQFKHKLDYKIIPFRGEYFRLTDSKKNLVNHLIYPVPDKDLPFLGVHLTPMINGTVTVGPNAVLAFKREGYSKLNFNLFDTISILCFQGFWRLIIKYLSIAIKEQRNSLIKSYYLKEVQKFCPSIQIDDLQCYPSGVRAQAVSKSGNLIHDFLIEETKQSILVCNAPSPGATSSLTIGQYIAELLIKKMTKFDIS